MATVIDSLLFTLGLDAQKFEQGRKQVTEDLKKTRDEGDTTAKRVNAGSKAMAENFGKVRGEVLKLATALVSFGSMKAFVQSITASDAAVGRLSKNVGMSANNLSAWEKVIKQFQGSAGEADDMFRNLAQNQQLFKNFGQMPWAEALTRAGMGDKISKFYADTTTQQEKALMLADAFSKLAPQTAQQYGQMMGFSESTITMLMAGRKQLLELEQQAARRAPNDKDANAAIQRAQKWDKMLESLENQFRKLVTDYTPLMGKAMDFITQHAEGTAYAIGAVGTAVTALTISSGFKVLMRILGLGGAAAPAGAAAAGGGAIAAIARTLGVGVWAATGTDDLNIGEDAIMARMHAQARARAPTRGSLFSQLEQKWQLPAGTLDAMWKRESNRGDPRFMRSPKGAKGHFGFMDSTAKQYGLSNPDDLNASANAAAHKMHDLLVKYHGDMAMALAAYNWGDGKLDKYGLARAPRETRDYIDAVRGQIGNGARYGGQNVVIGQINIQTQATDAQGIARSIGPALRQHGFASQADGGLR